MRQIAIAAVALLACTSAKAEAPGDLSIVDAKLKACQARHGDTPGVNNCYAVATAAADKRLNEVYGGLINALKHSVGPEDARDDAEILKRLIASERAWIPFRDAQCSYQSTVALGGTGESTESIACEYAQNKARLEALTGPDAPQNSR